MHARLGTQDGFRGRQRRSNGFLLREYFMQCERWYCGRILDPSDVRTLAKSFLASRDYALHSPDPRGK